MAKSFKSHIIIIETLMLLTMKKYIPVFAAIFMLSFYLVSQGIYNNGNPTATPAGGKAKQYAHYENMIKKLTVKPIGLKAISLKARMPEVLIVNFWASWCVPCLEEFPSLVNLYKEYAPKGLEVFGINTDEKDQLKLIEKTRKKHLLNFPLIADKSGKYINDFMVQAIPVSIIFHRGKVMEISHGSMDFESEEFKEKLDEWLK
jgi:thiol-disulfide isomerase/thioredoxin